MVTKKTAVADKPRQATPEHRAIRRAFLYVYTFVGLVFLVAFAATRDPASALGSFFWAESWAFLGFAAIVRKVLNHWPNPLPSYWSIYPWAVAGLGAFVFGVCWAIVPAVAPAVKLSLIGGPCFLLGYNVDRFVR